MHPDIRAHQPRQLDVPYAAIHWIVRRVTIDPFLLHEFAFQSHGGGDAGDLAGVVALHAADRDEGVAVLGEGVRDQVFEFAGFVAAARDGRVEVVAFRVDLDVAAEGGGDVGKGVDGGL
jgi:hypothetical protein